MTILILKVIDQAKTFSFFVRIKFVIFGKIVSLEKMKKRAQSIIYLRIVKEILTSIYVDGKMNPTIIWIG